jgi:hypothetical protein
MSKEEVKIKKGTKLKFRWKGLKNWKIVYAKTDFFIDDMFYPLMIVEENRKFEEIDLPSADIEIKEC